MKEYFKIILPSLFTIIGVAVGSFLTSSFNRNDWQERINYENKTKIFEQQLKLIERTTQITSKMPAASNLFSKYMALTFDSSLKNNDKTDIELVDRLSAIRSELFSVMHLNQIYFGDLTRREINDILGNSKEDTWWNIPDSSYNRIISAMTFELNLLNTLKQSSNGVNVTSAANSMSETMKILWTAVVTIIGGIFIYVIGRIIEKFVLEPLQEYKKFVANIANELVYYADIYANASVATDEDKKETSRAIRRLGANLRAITLQIRFYNILYRLGVLPKYDNSINASAELIGLSNSMWRGDFSLIEKRVNNIKQLLNIKP